MIAIILAAGYGTRLYPLTLNKPKALLEVGKRTILSRLADDIEKIGACGKTFIVTNEKFYKNFSDWSGKNSYSFDTETLNDGTKENETRLGAIGDIDFTLKKIKKNEDLLITGSDNLFEFHLKDFYDFAVSKKPASSMVLFDVKDKKLAKNYGICALDKDSRIVDFLEKPQDPPSTLAATALYFVPKEKVGMIHDYMKTGLSKDAPGNLMKWLAEKDRLYGYVTTEKWYDIGDKVSLDKADKELTEKEGGTK